MNPTRVLVVDDEEIARRNLSHVLTREGYTVDCAQDGAAALALLGENAYQLVLTDLRMPGIDGFEMIRRLRADPQLQELDIVVVSGLADDEILENGGLPADVILYSKPVPFRELKGYVQAKIMAMQRRGRAL